MSMPMSADRLTTTGEFGVELTKLINRCNIDGELNTPDFVLSQCLLNILYSLKHYNEEKTRLKEHSYPTVPCPMVTSDLGLDAVTHYEKPPHGTWQVGLISGKIKRKKKHKKKKDR